MTFRYTCDYNRAKYFVKQNHREQKMFRKIVNYKLIQSFEQYLTKSGCVKNFDNQFSKWNLQHFKACSTKSIDLLYASKDPDKNRNLKRIQLRV